MRTYTVRRPKVEMITSKTTESKQEEEHLNTEETIRYQRREIIKDLTLLEGHLQQACKINSKPCDCCHKHPIKLEALAEETAGMTPELVFRELAKWAREIAPITTEAASASGKYDKEYPKLAMKAREFRKAIMPAQPLEKEENEQTIPPTKEGQ